MDEVGEVFGWELILDLYGCNPATIASREEIVKFSIELCDDVLDMKRFGEPWAERFGLDRAETAGYTLVQLIETSSVVAHFSEFKRSVYLEIFSCKEYDQAKVVNYCRRFFEAKTVKEQFIERR